MSEEAVVVGRKFRAPISKIWAAWTEPEQMLNWWEPLIVAEWNPVEGGTYRLRWESYEGTIHGTFLTVRENELIEFTWEPDPVKEGFAQTRVEVHFKAIETGTRVEIRHLHDISEMGRSAHLDGWTRALENLGTAR